MSGTDTERAWRLLEYWCNDEWPPPRGALRRVVRYGAGHCEELAERYGKGDNHAGDDLYDIIFGD